jgi:hypothetical protein
MPRFGGAIDNLGIAGAIQAAGNSQGKSYLPQVIMLKTMITAKIVTVTRLP